MGREPLKRLVCLALLAPLTSAAPASADVSIGRATTDGEGLNPAFIDDSGQGDPGDVAVARGHIYWVAGNSIGRANLDGSGVDPEFIDDLGAVGGLTADNQYLYWGGASIGRVSLDGTGAEPAFMSPDGGADDVAVMPPFLYWTSDVGIGRANVDGTGANPRFIDTGVTAAPGSPQGVYPPAHLAVAGTRVFWTASAYDAGTTTSEIDRAFVDGGGAETVLRGGGFRGDYYGPLGADDERVFFRVRAGLDADQIRSFDANFAPGSATGCCSPSWTTTADPDLSDPFGGVALADGHVFWAHAAERGLHCDLDPTKRRQRQRGRTLRFAVWFGPCELIDVRASGRVKVAGVRYRLKRFSATVNPSDSSIPLELKRADRDAVLGALKDGQTASAKVRLRITDTSGNAKAVKYGVRLARRAR